jgi:hypothetical protein
MRNQSVSESTEYRVCGKSSQSRRPHASETRRAAFSSMVKSQ